MSAFTIQTNGEGNLTADPVLRETSDKTPVCNMRVAVSRSVPDAEGGFVDKTEFINLVAWRSHATNAAGSLKKGDRIVFAGDLRANDYTDKDGVKRYTSEVHLTMLGTSLRWALAAPVKQKDMAQVPETADA